MSGSPFEPNLPPPTLDEQVRLLTARFGADAVRESVHRIAKKKRGRKAERDWPLLSPWCEQDAADWLEGKDPLKLRSNYSIAKEFAERYPGHSRYATKDRIERKLKKQRRWAMLVRACRDSEAGHPFSVYLRAVGALAQGDAHPVYERWIETALATIARYRERFGEPEAHMTFAAIEEKSKGDWLNALMPPPSKLTSLFADPTTK